jgi:hypothetical protein
MNLFDFYEKNDKKIYNLHGSSTMFEMEELPSSTSNDNVVV